MLLPTGFWCSAISDFRRWVCAVPALRPLLSNIFLFAVFALVVAWHPKFRRYHLFGNWWRADWPRLAKLWRIGLPIGATLAFEITVFNAAVFLMGQFGTAAIAAHAIAIQIASISFMVPMGLSQAATVRVGLAKGAVDRDGITRAGWTAFGLAVAFMASMSMLLLAAPRLLIGAFIDLSNPANAVVIDTAMSFLFCAAVFQIADGAQSVAAGMLRGLQDTRVPMIFAALGYWGFGMGLSLLFAFKLGFWRRRHLDRAGSGSRGRCTGHALALDPARATRARTGDLTNKNAAASKGCGICRLEAPALTEPCGSSCAGLARGRTECRPTVCAVPSQQGLRRRH